MKYLCLVYAEERKLAEMSEEETKLTARSIAYNYELMRSGNYVVSAALCGFLLLDAQDLDEAIRLASKVPMARVGCIEIRPIMRLEEGTQ